MSQLHEALHALRSYDPMTAAQHEALDTRIRREITSRFGSFTVPERATVHTTGGEGRGMLVLLLEQVLRGRIWTGLRPALVLASVAAFAVGATVAVVTNRPSDPVIPVRSPSVPAAPGVAVAPVIAELSPGSGSAVSVFAIAYAVPGAPAVRRNVRVGAPSFRTIPKPVTPAAGVFTTWGSGVFSEQEILRNRAREIGVFSGAS